MDIKDIDEELARREQEHATRARAHMNSRYAPGDDVVAEPSVPPPVVVSDRRERTTKPRDFEVVAKEIVAARSTKQHSFVRTDRVVRIIIKDIQARGELYNDGTNAYVFLRDRRILLPIGFGVNGLELILRDYGLLPKEYITRHVIDGIRLAAFSGGTRIKVHAFSYYSHVNHIAYIYDFDGGVFRVTEDRIDHVNNGTDQILFRQNPQWSPLVIPQQTTGIDWRRWLMDGVRFTEGALSDADQRLVISLWVLSLFFPQLFPTKVILALIGEKGSGKTSFLRRIGCLLFGSGFNVTALTTKSDDFDAAITTDPLVVADNADDAPKWLPDRLAVLATGGTIKRRIYYTTNELGEYPICATLAITSRTPNFHREDVAERLLPLTVGRIDQFRPEHDRLNAVEAQRGEVVRAILLDVMRAIRELKAAARTTHSTSFRMADFADFVLKVAPVVSTRQEVTALLTRLGHQQVSFAAEEEPLLPLIDVWLRGEDETSNVGREISTSDLRSEIERMGNLRTSVPWDVGNAKSFGQYFRQREGTLTSLYGMTKRSVKGGYQVVTFRNARGADLGDTGGAIQPPRQENDDLSEDEYDN